MSTAGHSPTDVSDEPWDILHLLLPKPTWRPGGPGRTPLALRRVLHGMFSVTTTGCQWRMMPQDWGHGQTISGSCRRWRREGVWERLMTTRRHWERPGQGRRPAPSAGGVERQRLKTATQGPDVGVDGNKQGKGRTRHLLSATRGLMVAVVVTAATTEDRQGWVELLKRACASGVQRLRKLGVEGGSQAQWLCEWVRRLTPTHKMDLAVVEHTGQGLQVVKPRWKVERTLVWLLNDRRHSRDDEVLTAQSEAMMQISMIRLLLKRLA
jgi:putative transposase